MKKYKINLILTFEKMDQRFMDVETTELRTQEAFIKFVLCLLNIRQQHDIVKISLCVSNVEGPDELPPWVLQTNGKIYFN